MRRRIQARARVACNEPSWMEAALQIIVLIAAALLLNACASTVQPRTQTARVETLSEDVSCMSECLDDDSETCDSCAISCLGEPRTDRVALGL